MIAVDQTNVATPLLFVVICGGSSPLGAHISQCPGKRLVGDQVAPDAIGKQHVVNPPAGGVSGALPERSVYIR